LAAGSNGYAARRDVFTGVSAASRVEAGGAGGSLAAVNPRHVFDSVFPVEVAIAVVVFVLACGAVLIAMLLSRRRKRTGAPPSQREERTKLELAYVCGIAAVVAFIVFMSFRTTSQEQDPASAASGVTVDVTGYQWCWRFAYPGHGVTVNGTCTGNDIPTMVVPVGEPITLRVSSKDVIHAWWVPYLRYKLDAWPDHTNVVTLTLPRAGRWIGRCSEFCGHGHSFMHFYLKAVPKREYERWLAGAST
jgi:cytochrome c oxidase subunit II